jgi:LysM repeat protein
MMTRFDKRLIHFSGIALPVMVAITLLAAILPQPVQAASAPCVTYYTYKKGDKTYSVAHTFGLAWWEIGLANNMKYPYTPTVGQRLCIPPEGWAESLPTVTGNLYAASKGSKVSVVASGFTDRYLWVVKVKDTTGAVSGDFKIGRMLIPKTTTVKGSFNLPSELRKSTYLTVCLKNQTTDEKICKNIVHIP